MQQDHIIIVAGGSGKRMGAEIPKQFIELAGKPILMHTLEIFNKTLPELNIVVVLPETELKSWHNLIKKHNFSIKHKSVAGGNERFFSVKNGLDTLPSSGLVGIHDGVRPLVSTQTIRNCYAKAEQSGNAIPVIPVTESVRKIKNNKSQSLNRKLYHLVQTPQVFQVNLLKKAYKQDFSKLFTDDASVVENLGNEINCVDGNIENIKITRPIDLKFAEALLNVDN